MKTTLLTLATLTLLSTTIQANFDFNECAGSGTFEQQIHKYANYEDAALVGEIPAGIEGLEISLRSDEDVDIRLYGENNDKIVHWPYGIHSQATQATKPYKDVPVTYSGYNGEDGEKGHEFIKIEGTTPTAMTMKAFGFRAGYATVNYSWTGKTGCTVQTSGDGTFTQTLKRNVSSLVGTIPPGVENVHINLNSDKDLDIQLFAQDGTAIASWKPAGLMSGENEQSLTYAGMDITWSGYNGVDGKKGHEYITISNTTSQMLVMKVYGYEAGTAEVMYSWGDASLPSTIQTEKTTYSPNETVAVNVQGYLSGDKDWVGIYPKGSNNDWNNVIKWIFVEHTGVVNITDTQYTSNDEMIAGDYEVRLFFHNSYDMEAKYAFHVSVDGGNKVYPKESILKQSAINTLYGDTMIPKPAKGQSVVDNVLGTKITQINKVEVEGRNTYSPYPKRQAWNKDMTLVRVGNRLYDAHTYEDSPITNTLNNDEAWTQLCSRASDSFIWSNIQSDTFYVLTHGNDFIKAKINGNETDCTNALDTFDEYEYVYLGIGEGNLDENDKYVVFLGKKKDDLKIYVILYDIQEKKRVWNTPKVLKLEDDKWIRSNNQWIPLHIDWISISPSGKHIVVNNAHGYASGDTRNGIFVYDRETFSNKTQLKYKLHDQNEIQFAIGEHGDIGYDQEGNEVWVQFVTHYGVYMFNLDKPDELGQEVLMSAATGGHISCRNIKRHGWCYVSNYNYDYAYAFAVKLEADTDGSNGIAKEKVELFSRTFVREWVGDPMDYPFAGVSPDGTKMIFNSYWGDNDLGTFIAEVADTNTLLTYGEPQTNIANKGTYSEYKIYAHAGDVLNVDLYDMDANGNLYVKAGSQASVENYDCKSENGGETHSTENDSCSLTIQNDGYVYVAVHAPTYGCYTNVKHTIKITKENQAYVYGSGVASDEIDTIVGYEDETNHPGYFVYYPKNHIQGAPLVLVSGYKSVHGYNGLMKYLASQGCYVVGHATRLDNQGWNDVQWRIEDFEPAVVAAQNLGVDTSRLITMGSSTGGMVAYPLMKHFKDKGYATENSIIIDIQGWYAQSMTKSQLVDLNSHSLIIALGGNNGVQQYSDGSDASQDPRVLLTLSKLMSKDKSFHVIDDIHHSYAGGEYADILTKENLLTPIDAMIKYEFFNDNGQYNDAETILFDQYDQTIHDVYTATMDYVGNDGDWKNGYYYPCVDKKTGGLIYPSIDYCNDHGLQ